MRHSNLISQKIFVHLTNRFLRGTAITLEGFARAPTHEVRHTMPLLRTSWYICRPPLVALYSRKLHLRVPSNRTFPAIDTSTERRTAARSDRAITCVILYTDIRRTACMTIVSVPRLAVCLCVCVCPYCKTGQMFPRGAFDVGGTRRLLGCVVCVRANRARYRNATYAVIGRVKTRNVRATQTSRDVTIISTDGSQLMRTLFSRALRASHIRP